MSDDEIGTDSIDLPNDKLPSIIRQDGAFPYIKPDEAAYILGLLKNVECTNCPCLIEGCSGGYTRQDLAIINHRRYLHQQVRGTEGFLCMKLRNIINLSEAERRDIEKEFEEVFKKRVAVIIDNGTTTVVSDSDVETRVAQIEKNMNEQLLAVQTKNQHEINNLVHQYKQLEGRAKQLEDQIIKTRQANENLAVINEKLTEENTLLKTRIKMGGK